MAISQDIPPAISFGDRWRSWRDALLASRRFQSWAAAFPLTRPIARRHAGELFDLCAGFVYSQVLVACVRLKLFEQLQAGPLRADVLTTRLAMPQASAMALLDAASALRLLERRSDGRYGLGPLGAAMLGNAGIAAMVEHHAALYADLADPVALLRGADGEQRLANYWPYSIAVPSAAVTQDSVAPYTELMSASQPMIAAEVLAAYPLHKHRCLLDVGGGDGSFLVAAARRAPQLQLRLFDLPGVAGIARAKLNAADVLGRTEIFGGDFLRDPLPQGADVISLIRVVHDHDDEAVLRLFANIRAVLPPDGVLLLGEPLAGASGRDRVSAYFDIYLRVMGQGRARRFEDLVRLLGVSGFSTVRRRRTRIPLIASVLVAKT